MKLSFVIPFYRKLGLFRLTLPHNFSVFAQDNTEVVLVLDEPESADGVLSIVRLTPEINWRVLVNEKAHDWRPPCKAINVGIRNAEGQRVAVISPETILQLPHPQRIREVAFDNYIIGIVFACDAWKGIPSMESAHQEVMQSVGFGFIMATRHAFTSVNGYDEERKTHGLDDDCIRWKLNARGPGVVDYAIRAIHLNHENPMRLPREKCEPVSMRCQPNWGQDFNKVIYDWRKEK